MYTFIYLYKIWYASKIQSYKKKIYKKYINKMFHLFALLFPFERESIFYCDTFSTNTFTHLSGCFSCATHQSPGRCAHANRAESSSAVLHPQGPLGFRVSFISQVWRRIASGSLVPARWSPESQAEAQNLCRLGPVVRVLSALEHTALGVLDRRTGTKTQCSSAPTESSSTSLKY